MSSLISLEQCLALHQDKQWQQAAEAYQQLLLAEPTNLIALANLGAVYRQLNEPEQARLCYQKAIEIDCGFVEGWFNFGNLCFALKDWEQAEACYQQVLGLQPKNTQALYQLAAIYRELQNWKLCRDQLQALLNLDKTNASGLLELGNVWKQLGENAKSRDAYLSLVAAHQNSWKGHYSLARWYDVQDELALCEKHLALALKYAPSAWVVHHNLAQARFDVGNYQGAMEQFEHALLSEPENPSTLISLGACAQRLGQTKKARSHFAQVSRTDDVSILSQLARVIWEDKYFEEAVAILKKIVSLRPELADAHLNLGKAHYQCWRMSQAKASIEQALALRPDYPEAEDLLVDLFLRQGQSDKCLPVYRQRIKRDGALCPTVSSYLFAELYSASVSAEEKFSHHKDFMDTWVAELAEPFEFKNNRYSEEKIRIGFVTADFRDQHPVGIFIQPVLNAMDRDRFSLVAYYGSGTHDDSTHTIKAKMDQWFDVGGWSDARLRSKIIDDEIDILVDLSGQTAKNRLRMFAMRAAPIQVTWMAYPHSTGLSTMDYLIGDSVVCPAKNDHLCSETVVRLPKHSVFCFQPTDIYGDADMSKARTRKEVVFGSFNNLVKVNAETLALWRDVVLAVPGSKLKLKTPSFTDQRCREFYLDYFQEEGIEADRLIFSGPSSLYDMMREYSDVDIALDTFPYNGGTTTFQALWMGVPVLTMEGDNFCGRMGASAMIHLGMEGWVASSRQDFIDRAIGFAQKRDELLEVKEGLRARMQASPLCDASGFGGEMNQVFEKLWSNYKS